MIVDYQPMTIAKLAVFIAAEPDFDTRWRLVVEFLKEFHQEPAGGHERPPARRRSDQAASGH